MFLSKYSASGNDFVIFHTFNRENRSGLARELCHRQNGIGADGLIVLVPHDTLDFEWEFYNSDGSYASMCGNGTRAAGLYAYQNGLCGKRMRFLSGAGEIGVEIFEDSLVETALTEPKYLQENIEECGLKWELIDTGVPHLVTLDEDLGNLRKEQLRELRHKYNANINIGKQIGEKLYIRTYERGVEDETLACGTGMAALFLHARKLRLVGESAKVQPASGEILELRIEKTSLFFKGKVKKVFDTIADF